MLNKDNIYLITDEKQRTYLTGFRATDGFVVVKGGEKYLFLDPRYSHAAKKSVDKKIATVVEGSRKEVFDFIKESGKKELFVDFNKTTLAEADAYSSLGVTLKNCSEELAANMIVKSEAELGKIKKACKIAEQSLKEIQPLIKEGVTESELAAALETRFRIHGATGPSFETIVAFGENAAVPHHETGNTKLKKNECVLIDFGCVYEGYCSDMTRTFFYGKPDEEFLKAYKAVETAHVTAEKTIYAGITCVEADKIARDILTEKGYGKYFTHSLGHGIGVNIHEAPALSPKGKGTLENGMVFSIEPGVYINGKFGIRIENTVTLKDGVVSPMMKTGKKLVVIGD